MRPRGSRQEILIFVASPSDVVEERNRVQKVADELNETIARNIGIVFKVLRWERDVIPALGKPQEIINEQIGRYQIFIGIMWRRFGDPTGEAGSGTEEEFDLAYNRWLNLGEPWVMFYFCKKNFYLDDEEEISQFKKVIDFKNNKLKGKGFYSTYIEPDEFEDKVRIHLSKLLLEKMGIQEKTDIPEAQAQLRISQTEQLTPPVAYTPQSPESLKALEEIAAKIIEKNLEKINGAEKIRIGLSSEEIDHIVDFLCSGIFSNIPTDSKYRNFLKEDLKLRYPEKTAKINTFWLSRYLVTNKLFEMFVKAENYKTIAEDKGSKRTWKTEYTRYGEKYENHPVVYVSYVDAEAFCKWVEKLCRKFSLKWNVVRLPSTKEFEFAVRGSENRLFPWGKKWEFEKCNDMFWLEDLQKPSKVGKFGKNGESWAGIHDLCGNVFEWVDSERTSTDGKYLQAGLEFQAGGSFDKTAVLRGHASFRVPAHIESFWYDVGFRFAADVKSEGE